jgi:hypothetical protein
MPPVVMPPGVIESVDGVEEEVAMEQEMMEAKTTMKPPKGESLCACYQWT